MHCKCKVALELHFKIHRFRISLRLSTSNIVLGEYGHSCHSRMFFKPQHFFFQCICKWLVVFHLFITDSTDLLLILEQRYKDQRLQKCCHSGLVLIPMLITCQERAERVQLRHKQDCVDAFLECCHEGKRLREQKRLEDMRNGFGRSMGSLTNWNTVVGSLTNSNTAQFTVNLRSWIQRH